MKARRGYTVMESMMALGVLAVGATGVIAVQKMTVVGNRSARAIATANTVAMTWVERLRVDAAQWSFKATPDLNNTVWLKNAFLMSEPLVGARPPWFIPVEVVDRASPDADIHGADIFPDDSAISAFCTHLSLGRYGDPVTGVNYLPTLIRAEIRVFWRRDMSPVDCENILPDDVDKQSERYAAVYVTTGILKNPELN
jgi:type IV pilus assembly protein PilV